MKGLKEFLEALKENEGLLSEVEKVQDDAAKVVEIAKKNGYSFTEDEYMDAKMDAVSGGDGGLMGILQKGATFASNYMTTNQNTSEDANFVYKRGKTGTWAQSKKDGNMYWQQYGGQWVEI